MKHFAPYWAVISGCFAGFREHHRDLLTPSIYYSCAAYFDGAATLVCCRDVAVFCSVRKCLLIVIWQDLQRLSQHNVTVPIAR